MSESGLLKFDSMKYAEVCKNRIRLFNNYPLDIEIVDGYCLIVPINILSNYELYPPNVLITIKCMAWKIDDPKKKIYIANIIIQNFLSLITSSTQNDTTANIADEMRILSKLSDDNFIFETIDPGLKSWSFPIESEAAMKIKLAIVQMVLYLSNASKQYLSKSITEDIIFQIFDHDGADMIKLTELRNQGDTDNISKALYNISRPTAPHHIFSHMWTMYALAFTYGIEIQGIDRSNLMLTRSKTTKWKDGNTVHECERLIYITYDSAKEMGKSGGYRIFMFSNAFGNLFEYCIIPPYKFGGLSKPIQMLWEQMISTRIKNKKIEKRQKTIETQYNTQPLFMAPNHVVSKMESLLYGTQHSFIKKAVEKNYTIRGGFKYPVAYSESVTQMTVDKMKHDCYKSGQSNFGLNTTDKSSLVSDKSFLSAWTKNSIDLTIENFNVFMDRWTKSVVSEKSKRDPDDTKFETMVIKSSDSLIDAMEIYTKSHPCKIHCVLHHEDPVYLRFK